MLTVNNLLVIREQQEFIYNLTAEEGGIVIITGASGRGKTTLLDALAGYQQSSGGTIIWKNTCQENKPPEQRPFSYMFQGQNLFNHLRIKDNFRAALPGTSQQEIYECLNQLQLREFTEKFPYELSGGQLQRIALIITTLRPEPILLLDEPFSALDSATSEITHKWLKAKTKLLRKTILMVSHNDRITTSVFTDNCKNYTIK